jgi:CheY-like chemotaxis protein
MWRKEYLRRLSSKSDALLGLAFTTNGKPTYAVDVQPMRPLRVMVVEDDGLIAELLRDVLEEMGHTVCASEGNEAGAVAAAVRCKPDLMVVDVRLGEGSGVSAVDKIQLEGLIPHIFVTGDIKRLKALRPGAEALEKPFRDSDLESSIERVIGAAAN